MAENDQELTGLAKEDRLALALARGMSHAAAGRAVGISERTVRRKLQSPALKALVVAYRDRLVGEAIGQLAATATPAVRKMRRLLKSKDEHIQLQASKAIIGSVVRLGSYGDLAERMAELEAKVAEQKGPTA